MNEPDPAPLSAAAANAKTDSVALAVRSAATSATEADVPSVAAAGSLAPSLLWKLEEIWFAWRVSRRLLRLYHRLRAEAHPNLARPLYEEVVARWAGTDVAAAALTLRRAEQSLVAWTEDREINLRDTATYLIASSYMQSYPGRYGMRAQVAGIVRWAIPAGI